MITLLDIEGFPKKSLKNKNIMLYRAFALIDDDEMNINPHIDLFAIDEESAIQRMINTDLTEEQRETFFQNAMNGNLHNPKNLNEPFIISFATIKIPTRELTEKDLVDGGGEIYFKDNILSVSIFDKMYILDVYDKRVTSLKLERLDDEWSFKIVEIEIEPV